MWMLLRQPDMGSFEDIESKEEVVEDWDSSDDIPEDWKRVVHHCLKHDPNQRIGLQELFDFWEIAKQKTQ